MAKTKIALFGGTFDPIHLAHTAVARAAAEHLGAEKVIFIPTKRSPLKQSFPQAGDKDRLNMIFLAIADDKIFEVSDYELKKTAPCFTIETVEYFQTRFKNVAELCWLIGADTIDELPRWYRITDLIDRCTLCAMFRAGCNPPDFSAFETIWGERRIKKLQANIIPTPLLDISSTDIRAKLAEGKDASDTQYALRQMLHPKVADYIRNRRLYQSPPPP
jgi:nicotinate-nucleotide adenylyltransferase